MQVSKSFERLIEIMATLRSKEGCPWDREQTHESLVPYCIEEAYEVVQAIEEKNWKELKSELGDLLLQVVFHAQLATEERFFTMEDVVESINQKMITRHPHVFLKSEKLTAKEVSENWENIKKKKEGRKSALQGIPRSLPSLMKAQRIGEKVGALGFDWKRQEDVREKVQEEWHELEAAMETQAEKEEEFGDLLFALVQWGRHLHIDSEQVLHNACEKFSKRFERVEKEIEDRGLDMDQCSVGELEEIWQQVK
ncbi:MAG: nucleoside triphosphate pyrophosphohydrolase [Bdellovibrionales bacterium]|nr:nucleoside triphosphate pyrophosphohydrolase [Bdellovibrionales bacterium]